ncbi:metal ABC transporter ATP-binding protein [Vibrio salinus]|uniref:metal ABC transporter ATP-binding protein n=1 Tax=Vibrio salinus TaxID=2899784 RepID=UPI001E401EDD|nr:ABC transporter ATP-binding protein [Vibrio salinus]MCE0495839.1 ABC transporter ATP-binding protein [Vibrio salinus]
MIKLRNLVVGYLGQGLAEPVTGSFSEGSLTAIMGENGTGKSTLLKTICGIQPAIGGDVEIKQCARMSWLPQQAEIDRSFPITVFDVVAMGCWPDNGIISSLKSKDIDNIYSALDEVGITDLVDYNVSQLSGGQFQRMLFARLLVQNAEIMLMDEPFTGIDSQTQNTLIRLICQLHERGKTIIAVLHNPEMVTDFFPETLAINNSCIHWGNTHEVMSQCQLFHQQGHIARFG